MTKPGKVKSQALIWDRENGRTKSPLCEKHEDVAVSSVGHESTAQCSGSFLMWVVDMGEFSFLMRCTLETPRGQMPLRMQTSLMAIQRGCHPSQNGFNLWPEPRSRPGPASGRAKPGSTHKLLGKVSGLALYHLRIREVLLLTGGSQTPEWSFWELVGWRQALGQG